MHIVTNRSIFSILFALCLTSAVYAQSVSGVQASIVDDKLQIEYRVTSVQSGQKFRVRLFSSIDNFANPIADGVEGAVGDDISLSTVNTITIPDPIGTLGPITGDVSFRVRAQLTYFPVSITSHIGYFSAKRGKKFNMRWVGGLDSDNVKFNLYRNLNLIQEDVYSTTNTGSAEFKMPKKLELGEGYSLQLSFPSLDAPVTSPDFAIKRKKSIGGRVFTWAVLLGGVGAIASLQAGGGDDELPDPPGLPGDEFLP